MENASKALIIAGAILLSILLISLAIMVYNQAKGTINDANLDAETIQTFNTKISQYCGSNKDAATMNSLMDAIAASNGAQKGKNPAHYISFDTSGCQNTVTKKANITVTASSTNVEYPRFGATATYSATYTTDANGYINKVTIK